MGTTMKNLNLNKMLNEADNELNKSKKYNILIKGLEAWQLNKLIEWCNNKKFEYEVLDNETN